MTPGMPSVMPLTPVVKRLLIVIWAVWLVGVILIDRLWLGRGLTTEFLGLVPISVIRDFFIWQPVTFLFVHAASNVFHIVFNSLILWSIGGELEARWGRQYFLTYFLVAGAGSGVLYVISVLVYYLVTGQDLVLYDPVVGMSGAIFGLLIAYGILFGDRIIHFFMLFPMPAKYFVLIIGGIEVASLLGDGARSGVANLAHLGGLASGFIFLRLTVWWRQRKKGGRGPKSRSGGRRLKLVVDNDRPTEFRSRDDDGRPPRFWN